MSTPAPTWGLSDALLLSLIGAADGGTAGRAAPAPPAVAEIAAASPSAYPRAPLLALLAFGAIVVCILAWPWPAARPVAPPPRPGTPVAAPGGVYPIRRLGDVPTATPGPRPTVAPTATPTSVPTLLPTPLAPALPAVAASTPRPTRTRPGGGPSTPARPTVAATASPIPSPATATPWWPSQSLPPTPNRGPITPTAGTGPAGGDWCQACYDRSGHIPAPTPGGP